MPLNLLVLFVIKKNSNKKESNKFMRLKFLALKLLKD